jgi:predicted RNase H-like HicB family nuclease
MLPNAVKLAVTASVPMEYEFRTEDDGWKGACVELSIAVHGSNFEEAKKNMEAALQTAVFGSQTGSIGPSTMTSRSWLNQNPLSRNSRT